MNQIYVYAKDPSKAKYTGLKYLSYSKSLFVEYSVETDDIYKNVEEYNPNKKRKILIVFNDMISWYA